MDEQLLKPFNSILKAIRDNDVDAIKNRMMDNFVDDVNLTVFRNLGSSLKVSVTFVGPPLIPYTIEAVASPPVKSHVLVTYVQYT